MLNASRALTAIAILCLVVTGCSDSGRVKVIKLGHGLSATHPVHLAMEFMDERLREKSGGTMRIDIYPSEQLGSERECLELLQIGSLGMTKVSAAAAEGFAPEFRVFSVPYLFRDDTHFWNVLNGPVGRDILEAGEAYWLRGLTYYDSGSRSFYTKDRPVRTPEDLQGLKIRVQESPMAINMVQAMGGSATPINFGELYSALQQGVVDGAENNAPSLYLSRHYEVVDYYTLDEHTSVPDILMISTKVWEGLTPQQQQWLQEAADESALYQRELWKEATDEALRAVQEAGVEIIRPDKAPFMEQMEPLYEQYRTDPAFFNLIQQIREVGTEADVVEASSN